MTTSNSREVLLSPEEKRWNLFPIRYPEIWRRYKQAFAALWTVGEVDLSSDLSDWDRLTKDERHFVSTVLAFFASADGIVNDNLAERFGVEVQIREAKCFYDLQKTMENVHNEMYSQLIQTYIRDPVERNRLFHAVEHIECVKQKAAWAERWINSTDSFATRLIAFAVVEGVFFSGSFCAIYWLKQRKLMPGLCQSNTLIARDEGMHQEFATYLYRSMVHDKLHESLVHEIVNDAVSHEVKFCCEALPVSLIGMNKDDMATYIKFVADRLLIQLGVSKLFHAVCPFDWMELISLEGKTNFFESRVAEYQKMGARVDAGNHDFSLDAVF